MTGVIRELKQSLKKEMEKQELSWNGMAERMHEVTGETYSPMQISRLLSLDHTSKIDTMEIAFAALGKKIKIMVQ